VRQTHKLRKRCGPVPWSNYTGWRVHSETESQIKEEMWALNHGANKGWRAHGETDSQIKEEMWALNHGENKGWRAHSETDSQIKEEIWALYPWCK
jgi:hypothetical protein